ncbi:zinc-dependent alcohol dehydrogenase [Hydrogenophaga palleronii]|uniref:zinc-dependent alcohol dehydrogenase n=1 Tax=Hydrogenophaga palleronii TaxID=65655 RepID=UPI000A0689E0|nr:alcohol dehydrogenase catalytic domain-containing protein [Hydrogenophaga palleronii]
MKALVYEGQCDLRLRHIAAPSPLPHEILVQVAVTGICGSDIGLFRKTSSIMPPSTVPGHEFGGWTSDGNFVVVNPMLSCGHCPNCQIGHTHLCPERRVMGIQTAGAYAEQVAVPRRNLVPAPGLTPIQAALVEPIANGLHAWVRAGKPVHSAAIIGAGAIGMCLLHVLRQHGVKDISVVDPVQARLDHAMAGGATKVMGKLEGRYGVVFDAAGTRSTREDAVACTVPGGTVAFIGLHDDILSLSAAALVVGDRTLCGCFAYTEQEFRDSVVLARDIHAPWAETVPIDAAEETMVELLAGRSPPERIKTLIAFANQ